MSISRAIPNSKDNYLISHICGRVGHGTEWEIIVFYGRLSWLDAWFRLENQGPCLQNENSLVTTQKVFDANKDRQEPIKEYHSLDKVIITFHLTSASEQWAH